MLPARCCIVLACLSLLVLLPGITAAQRPLPRALYIIQPGPEVPGFPQYAGSLELIYNNNGARQDFVNFLRREYDDYEVRYTCIYLMVETGLLDNASYRENLAGLLRFFRKNGITRIEAMYYPADGALNYPGGVTAFARAVRTFNGFPAGGDIPAEPAIPADGDGGPGSVYSGEDARFDALHFFLMPNRYPSFVSFENRYSRANQELFDHLLGEMKQAREAGGGMEVAVTADADSFFGVGETIVFSTGMSFGVSISALADRVVVMNYRDFATGTRPAGGNNRTAGLLLNIRPVLHVLSRDNIRADMALNAAPYRHPRYGNNSGFSAIPGYREGRSGRSDLNRQLRRTERNLTSTERAALDHIAIFYYGAY